jgi:hypothetical protein
MPVPGDYDDGEIGGMIGRGNRIAKYSVNISALLLSHGLPSVTEPGSSLLEAYLTRSMVFPFLQQLASSY